MYLEEINKVALSADDDKRIILKNGISTIPYWYNGWMEIPDDIKEKHDEILKSWGVSQNEDEESILYPWEQ